MKIEGMQCAAAGARPKSRAVNCTSPTSSLLAGQKGEKYSTGQIIALRALMTSLRINQYKNVDLDGWRPTSAAEQRCMMRGALQEGLEARCSCRRNAMQASCSLRLRPQRPHPPKAGLARCKVGCSRDQAYSAPRPQACCCRLHPRLLHHGCCHCTARCTLSNSAALCCVLVAALCTAALAKFWVTAASVRLGSARKALHAGASPLRKDFAGFASWFVWLSHV